jgi:hypothetical protein
MAAYEPFQGRGQSKMVQQMLRHESATMTLALYRHLLGDRLDVVADADGAHPRRLQPTSALAVRTLIVVSNGVGGTCPR